MNISLVAEKTNYLMVNGTEVKVSTLPEPIRYEVETLDRFRQQKLEQLLELEKIELSIKTKEAQLSKVIAELYKLNPKDAPAEVQET